MDVSTQSAEDTPAGATNSPGVMLLLTRLAKTVVVTPAGRRASARGELARGVLEDEVLAGLGPEDRATLGELPRRALRLH